MHNACKTKPFDTIIPIVGSKPPNTTISHIYVTSVGILVDQEARQLKLTSWY